MTDSEKQPRGTDTPQQWFLKIDEGSVFGPASLQELRAWAEQGRIAPGNEISSDRKKWIPAEDLSELEMVWKIRLEAGEWFGPLNIRVLRDLLNDGTVLPNTPVRNVDTQETSTVEQKMDLILGPAAGKTAVELARRDEQIAALTARISDLEKEAAAATEALAKAEELAGADTREHHRFKQQADADAGKLKKRVAELEKQTGETVDRSKWNPMGGAIAFGHPNGASGARICMFAMRHMIRTGGRYGVFSSCCGGGLGVAAVIENLQR